MSTLVLVSGPRQAEATDTEDQSEKHKCAGITKNPSQGRAAPPMIVLTTLQRLQPGNYFCRSKCGVRWVPSSLALFLEATDCSVWFTVTFTFDRFVSICCQELRVKYCTERVTATVLGTVTALSCLKNITWALIPNLVKCCNGDKTVTLSSGIQLLGPCLDQGRDDIRNQVTLEKSKLGIGLVILDPEEVTYIETQVKGVIGRSVVLECGQSLPTIYIWGFTRPGSSGIRAVLYDYGMGAKLQKMASMFGEVKVLSNSASLVIDNLQLAAEGRFTCQSLYDTNDGAKLVYIFVDLYVLVPITNPSIQMSTSAPVEGSTISISCSVENGTGPLEYIWNRQATLSRSPVNISETTSSQLNLTSVNRNHTGWYTCTARNEVNEATSNRVWLDVIYGPDQPAINITPYSLNSVGYSAIELDTVSMICSASSNPPSQYIWFHNNSQIYAGQQFVIERISRRQTGTYMCLAHNTVLNTRTKTTIVLTVYLLPGGRPKCSATSVKNLAYTMLSCSWEGGLPQASLQWKDWRSNSLGKAERSINNQVLKSSPIYNGKEFICQATHPLTRKAPDLLTPRNVVTVFEGSDVHLTCILKAAYPSSEITWHNNRNESIWLKPKKYLLHQEASWSNLTIREIDGDNDNGTYWCTASNVVGSSTTGINLHVNKYPTPPNVTISKLLYSRQRTEVVLEWITRGSGDLTGFMVQRRPARRSLAGWGRSNLKESVTDTHIPWQVVANAIDPAVRGHKLGGLDPRVLYAFRILAVNHKTTGYPSEVKTPADPPFSALPAVIGAAVVGMLVAVAGTVLVFRYVIRNRENIPWLHDLLFQHELREQINYPEDAEAGLPAEGEDAEGRREQTEESSPGASGEEVSATPATIEPSATDEQDDTAATEPPST
ncbi:V-set and immunoglobulin domain-containing protein 10-like 2 [Pristis pectinata]|uniref:V-set and immunoglobulin domain-containing protein 10-like 2 n=1 Tax=Pristis pectinata TaxID=685728 RepID=UPI00223DC91D|nr:V-set and immunoglobulin domain-containing protein 10-like 2 [Pristis pectinata]